jgi:myo-inositol 2-dehydrogenase/D-chiro-inositol 1-dehydrogenase
MRMKLRLGFIGLGAMGLSHLQAMHRLCGESTVATAVCATNPESIAKARDTAPDARIFKNPEDLIAGDLDAVFVSTPNSTHVDLAEKILKAGKHLFLEKPCGINADECRRLLNAAKASPRVTMIGHEFRYSPYFKRIKELAAAGEIGKPWMTWTREWRGPFQKKSGNWIQDKRLSGGCLVDKNCHHFDLMNWWMDDRPAKVGAFGDCAVNKIRADEHQVHDHATTSFQYENGGKGTLQLSMFALDFPNESLEMGLIGDAGMLMTSVSNLEIHQWRRAARQEAPVIHKVPSPRGVGWGNHLGFDEMHLEFARCITTGAEPQTSVEKCVDGTLLAIAAEESIATGAMATVANVAG